MPSRKTFNQPCWTLRNFGLPTTTITDRLSFVWHGMPQVPTEHLTGEVEVKVPVCVSLQKWHGKTTQILKRLANCWNQSKKSTDSDFPMVTCTRWLEMLPSR
eukprot:Lithocolla_globosa_v1_NODE_2177_length_2124_cov_21.896568.p2 type:complete len:102 gc:universal NODE_2177_length_2124_cov_21.896568:144-449(+)